MKNILLTHLAFFSITIINAQSIQRSVIGSAGKVYTSGAYKMSFTVGEALTNQYTAASLKLNQGFQQGIIASTPLPIVGVEFKAFRLNNNEVQLTWKSLQEINNKGFYIQRQLQHESDFTEQNFVASKADGGNSSKALNYSFIDMNSYNGNSYYRLKQEDLDGKYIYTLIRQINGSETSNELKAWPQPSNGLVNVVCNSNLKKDKLLVLGINGEVLQQHCMEQNKPIQILLPKAGMYILRLQNEADMSLKVVNQ